MFNKGKGECPFKDSCFYSHIDKQGNYFEYGYADDKLINSEGQWVDDHEPTLAERMGMIWDTEYSISTQLSISFKNSKNLFLQTY